jgi:hypothetical protein
LKGEAPIERIAELRIQIPDREDVALAFDANAEPLRFSSWAADNAMKRARQLNRARTDSR